MVKKEVQNEIIDFEKKGNLVRFYLGKNGKQRGDGWDDAPYEHNAEKVYDEYIKGYCDIVADFDCQVNELHESLEVTNTKYCKDDMKKRDIFCIRIISLIGFKKYTIKFGDSILDILKLECCHLVELIYKEGEKK